MASGSSLSKGILVLLFVGAVFMGLTFLLDKAPEQTPIASTPSTSTGTGDHANDPAVAEAREIGSEIGARIGEEIGRRVGETLVANLDMPAEEVSEPAEEPTLMADASGDMPDETPVDEESVSEPAQPEVTDEPEVISAAEPEPEPEPVAEEVVAPESEAESVQEIAEEEDYGAEEAASEVEVTESEEQTIPAPAVESEPDPSKKFVFASSGWWNQSSGSNGFSVKHVGQAVTATGIKSSIVVILSAPFNGRQSLEDMITINDSEGSAVSGTWRRSANSRNLFFRVIEPGTYQVSISADLSSSDGVSLGEALSGPITIQ